MEVYYAFLNEQWDNLDEFLLQYVSDERRKKVLSYRFKEDRKLSLYVELLSRLLLSSISSKHYDNFTFKVMEYGKPIVVGNDGFHISLSHTRMCVAVCVSKLCQVGIDVEKINDAPIDIIKTCFSQNEIDAILRGGIEGLNERFYKMWTCKEAYLKQIGCGLVDGMELKSIFDINDELFSTWSIDGYQFACCSEVKEVVNCRRISEKEIKNFYFSMYKEIKP